jgi:hypothetical protein
VRRVENSRVYRGRCKSEPAVTVRDPSASSRGLMWCNSTTDGESPDGRFTRASSARKCWATMWLSTPAFVRPDEWRDQWISKKYSCGC